MSLFCDFFPFWGHIYPYTYRGASTISNRLLNLNRSLDRYSDARYEKNTSKFYTYVSIRFQQCFHPIGYLPHTCVGCYLFVSYNRFQNQCYTFSRWTCWAAASFSFIGNLCNPRSSWIEHKRWNTALFSIFCSTPCILSLYKTRKGDAAKRVLQHLQNKDKYEKQ